MRRMTWETPLVTAWMMPGNAIEDGADRIEDAVDGDGVPNKSHSMLDGVSYEEMLRNGKVHDTDGDLTDDENAVSGSAY